MHTCTDKKRDLVGLSVSIPPCAPSALSLSSGSPTRSLSLTPEFWFAYEEWSRSIDSPQTKEKTCTKLGV